MVPAPGCIVMPPAYPIAIGGAMEHPYNDIALCYKDLLKARETFGCTTTTPQQYNSMELALSLMFIYCPQQISTLVESTIVEAAERRTYFEMLVWHGVETAKPFIFV